MTNEPISPVSDEYEDTGNAIFYRYAPFIQEFIYRNQWAALRGVQLAAAKTLFDTDHNLLITSSTASGKTEAAFFPILSQLWENPPQSVGVLYIAPLKSLINVADHLLCCILHGCEGAVAACVARQDGQHHMKLPGKPFCYRLILPPGQSAAVQQDDHIPVVMTVFHRFHGWLSLLVTSSP